MAPTKAAEALQRQKEARQKKMLIALAPILLLLLAWQGPGIFKQITGGTPPPPAPAASSTSTEPAAADPTTAAAPTTAGGVDPAVVVAAPGSLPDTDGVEDAGPGQLIAFDRFLGKDPFKQQVVAKEPDAGGAPPPGGTNPPPPGGGDPPRTITPQNPGTAPTSALMDINGNAETVSTDGTFPTSDPIFRLAAISNASVKVGLVSGTFSDGRKTITVRRGKSVTLVSQPDGVRYVITFVAIPKS